MGELLLSTMVIPVDNFIIGIQLKKARLEKKMSQEDVANAIGLTWEMISRYENGRSSALKHLRRLAEIYDKPLNYFINNKNGDGETFDLNQIVSKLKEEGIGYSKSLRNVVKILDCLTGKGIDQDLLTAGNYYEVSTNLTDRYNNLFALKLDNIVLQDVKLEKHDIGIFSKGLEAREGDVVIGYDGISYKILPYNPNGLETPLAVLILSERSYRS